MSEQRIPFSVRDESYQGLKDWYADRLDTWLMNQLGGNASQTDTRYTGNNTAVEPDTSHFVLSTGTAGTDLESSLSASSTFSLNMIDKAVAKAKTFTTGSNPIIRPLKVNGADKYVCFIHPFQHYQLRNNTASGQYLDIQKAAITGGQIGNNPIYTGAYH